MSWIDSLPGVNEIMRAFVSVPLPEVRLPQHGGVYLLKEGLSIVYVGQSPNVGRRVLAHVFAPPTPFDGAMLLEMPGSDHRARCAVESSLQHLWKPRGNGVRTHRGAVTEQDINALRVAAARWVRR